MDIDGRNRKQITDIRNGITNYAYSPNLKQLLYTTEVKLDEDIHDIYPDLPHANAQIEDDIMYRHWDVWEDESYSHIFLANVSEGRIKGEPIDIMKDERYDSPTKPFGGIEQVNWAQDSKGIAYSCKKLVGKAYALSTNTDIYFYDIEKHTTSNLTSGMMGYDLNPCFSPDGKYMAWESMERDGYESDKNRLFVMNLTTGKKKDYSVNFDQNTGALSWSSKSNKIWFISNHLGTNEIYSLDISNGNIKQITDGMHNYYAAIPAGDKLITTKGTMSQPTEIYVLNPDNGKDQELSFENKDILAQLKMGKVESRWIETTDKKKMQTWVIYPPDFDPNKKYPTLLYCQGGPQSTVSQFWSLRWNFQLMAANDYIIVAPNRRGLPGFGQEWNEQISGDYGGKNMKDYFSAIDELAKEPYVDENRLGAIGASYGGFSVYWLAGNHDKRFKAFVSHCGIFNFEQMYATTEEMFFVNWDLKGAYWIKNNKVAQNSYANSPHKFIGNWDTPILVIHGEKDFRIPYTQGMGAFNSAIMRNIPARFLYFPDENHWVLSPQNGILWHREFFRWLDSYLK
jgi:dipeptidyl aminopeptidase/acylaminoacyl peptidase